MSVLVFLALSPPDDPLGSDRHQVRGTDSAVARVRAGDAAFLGGGEGFYCTGYPYRFGSRGSVDASALSKRSTKSLRASARSDRSLRQLPCGVAVAETPSWRWPPGRRPSQRLGRIRLRPGSPSYVRPRPKPRSDSTAHSREQARSTPCAARCREGRPWRAAQSLVYVDEAASCWTSSLGSSATLRQYQKIPWVDLRRCRLPGRSPFHRCSSVQYLSSRSSPDPQFGSDSVAKL